MRRLHSAFKVEFDLIGLDAALGDQLLSLSGLAARNQMGRTSLAQSAGLLRDCDLLVSNDSGPAHLMAALDRPVWILWSGTAPSSVWAPIGPGVHLVESGAYCAPCGRGQFDVAHPCMAAISVDRVFESLATHLKGRLS
jgi:ADP-heptose:LPS heptosyltransferase